MKNKSFVNLWRAILVILGFSFITCLIFFKIFTKGLYPVPGDLLVSFYFPWYSGGWEGYDSWTTRKELLAADAIRQIYLWKEFAADQFKNGQFPLWNPYTFSGQPLAANFQSSVYYPANVFYFLTDSRVAWLILIVLQPFLAGIFMFLALGSFKISRIPSIFAAIAFMFSSYFITWLENGNISHSYLWLPLAIWSINSYFDSFKVRYYLVLIFSFSMSILAGHPQTVIYIFLATTAFWIYKMFGRGKTKLQLIAIYLSSIFLTILITAIQIVPTMDFYKDSPISQPFAKSVFDEFILPYQNLVTFLVPDFFGHPASNNFWSKNYGDFTPYFGVIPFIFSIWAIVKLWNKNFIKFATLVSIFFIFAAVAGPITWFVKTFEVPLLDATSPARFISISIFFLIILAGFGLSDLIANIKSAQYLKKLTKFLIFCGVVYLALWVVAFVVPNLFGLDETGLENFLVTRRNLILPSVMFFTFAAGVTVYSILLKLKVTFRDISARLLITGIFSVTIFGGVFYSNKFLPTAPLKFIFPEHPIFDWLQNNAQIYRFYGGGTAKIDQNHPIHYGVFGAEGYDTLRLKRYAELLISADNHGQIPDTYSRSDAYFPNVENGYRKRLFDLLGVKYLLDKEDNPKSGSDWHYERFPGDKVVGEWQEGKFQIYKRGDVLPRIFLTTNYEIVKQKEEILRKIYDPSFDLTNLILEEEITLNMEEKKPITLPDLEKYESNSVEVKTIWDVNSLLFLSDAYTKDWKAFIDGLEVPLHRAHYALRAVEVPKGDHRVVFKYRPVSHTKGLVITLFSVLFVGLLTIFAIRFKKF